MSSNAISLPSAPVTVITKFRVHTLDLLKAAGFSHTQVATQVDKLTKGQETILLTWKATQLQSAIWTKGTQVVDQTQGTQKLKLQRVDMWAKGQVPKSLSDLNFKWNLATSKLAALEARAGEIKVVAEAPVAEVAPAKPRATKPKAGLTNEARQAQKDQEHISQM